MEFLGNQQILQLPKTAFLCSQKVAASSIMKCYEWAKAQREAGNCIICGNQSQIEKDVVEILLCGQQPLVLMLGRGMKKQWSDEILAALAEKRLLIISPFSEQVKRVSRTTARRRNQAIIKLSDRIVVGYFTPNGQLDELLKDQDYELLST